MLQPIFGLLVRIALGAARHDDHIKAFRAQEKLVRGMRHHLPAEVPEMHGEIIVFVIGDAGEDARLFVDRVLDGDALCRPVWRLGLTAVQHIDERRLAHIAVADEDRPHPLELFSEQAVPQRLEVGVDLSRALRKLLPRKQRPLLLDLPLGLSAFQTVAIPIDPNLEASVEALEVSLQLHPQGAKFLRLPFRPQRREQQLASFRTVRFPA